MTMRRRYATADVFTDRLFTGNPVAVVLDAEGLSTAQMQAITCEFNYSETTFILPARDAANKAWVRIFTPSREIPFAGHPNIGTAFVLARNAVELGERAPERFIFEEAAGLVPVTIMTADGHATGAELAAPEPLSRHTQVDPAQVAACIGLSAADVRIDAHQPQVISVGLPFLAVELVSRDALRRAAPRLDGYAAVLPLDGATSVYAYTRDTGDSGVDVQARMFTVRMTEDPATGSATAAAAALLADLRGDGIYQMRFAQGVDMGRPSALLTRAQKSDGVVRAWVGGQCVAVMEGMFRLAGLE
jgi:trans-2,3-dihydro-3-hydroxyanthranilate isomerase